jgi:RNA polymerase sigma-70 factor (family 1)
VKPDYIRSILLRIAQKDEMAFKEFFDHYYPRLVQFSLTFVPGVIAAQEIVSDLLYKILKNPKSLVKVNDFDNYLYIAVRNQSRTYLKKNLHYAQMDSLDVKEDYLLPAKSPNPESALISEELFKLINKIIRELPPKRRVIFQLVKEEKKKYREVAEILNISVKTVELQMSLALKELRQEIADYQSSKDIKVRNISHASVGSKLFSIFF